MQADLQGVFCIQTPACFHPVQNVFQCYVNMTVWRICSAYSEALESNHYWASRINEAICSLLL